MLNLLDYLPAIPDFPKPGIAFRDICPLLAEPAAFAQAVASMQKLTESWQVEQLAGVEARGLIFAAALSSRMNRGLVLIRKPGKLPPPTNAESYSLEYGTDTLEMQSGIVTPQARILLVDDVIATGGTLLAARRLVEKVGANVVGVVALLGLEALLGVRRLENEGLRVATVLTA
jgi:adenine phosphoribosyltransferase